MVAKAKAKKVVKEEVVEKTFNVEMSHAEYIKHNTTEKEWVNLTDDEIRRLNTTDNLGELQYARAIERALKAKNNG